MNLEFFKTKSLVYPGYLLEPCVTNMAILENIFFGFWGFFLGKKGMFDRILCNYFEIQFATKYCSLIGSDVLTF
jgi:hypothetical protein